MPAALMASSLSAQTSPLNDTGQSLCFDQAFVQIPNDALRPCSVANTGDGSTHPRQDARFGRDAQAAAEQLTKIGAGEAGFDFTKIANNGSELPVSAELGSGPGDWACTRDNVTGLNWEVKTSNNAGDLFNFDDASAVHAAAVNSAQLCGYTDWRVPTRRELLSIVHFGRSVPAIDLAFFPNTNVDLGGSVGNPFFWSSDILVHSPASAWNLGFGYGFTYGGSQTNSFHVLLVRSGQ